MRRLWVPHLEIKLLSVNVDAAAVERLHVVRGTGSTAGSTSRPLAAERVPTRATRITRVVSVSVVIRPAQVVGETV